MSQPSCLSSGVSFLLLRGPSVRGSYRNAIRVGPRIRLPGAQISERGGIKRREATSLHATIIAATRNLPMSKMTLDDDEVQQCKYMFKQHEKERRTGRSSPRALLDGSHNSQ